MRGQGQRGFPGLAFAEREVEVGGERPPLGASALAQEQLPPPEDTKARLEQLESEVRALRASLRR